MAKPYILPTIVISQFCCTSLWFASNGVMQDLVGTFTLDQQATGHLTSAVQFGFISGTFLFALLTIADRYSPTRVFFICALLGSLSNLGLTSADNSYNTLIILRVATGVFLAGIYPVGMKIAADYFEKGLGKSLGYLVGALVVGTSFPHLLNSLNLGWDWQIILWITSGVAFAGGLLMWILVPDGPYRKKSQQLNLNAIRLVFKNPTFRSAAFGYFGHMWELYTFWAFVPMMMLSFLSAGNHEAINIPFWSFLIIGCGGIACIIGGQLSLKFGAKKIATLALAASGICCLLSPLLLQSGNQGLFFCFMVFWGLVVIADSPLFSTLVAQNADPEIKGTALTIVNSIGFAITIVSIQLISWLLIEFDHPVICILLAIGPAFGLFHLMRKAPNHA